MCVLASKALTPKKLATKVLFRRALPSDIFSHVPNIWHINSKAFRCSNSPRQHTKYLEHIAYRTSFGTLLKFSPIWNIDPVFQIDSNLERNWTGVMIVDDARTLIFCVTGHISTARTIRQNVTM